MAERLIIAFSGKAGSGKSTLAHMVQRNLMQRLDDLGGCDWDLPIVVTSFADALRKECGESFPQTDFHEKPTTPLVRKMLVAWGQLRRLASPDYWVQAWAAYAPRKGIIIVDDLRFNKEAMYLRTEEDAILIRIHTPDNPLKVEDDVSETDLDSFDYFDLRLVADYGDLESLLNTIWQHIRNRRQNILFD